jgi:hypothetical protein
VKPGGFGKGASKGVGETSDGRYGGRTPVGRIEFRELSFPAESAFYVSRYSVGVTVFMIIGYRQGPCLPCELTFDRQKATGFASLLDGALKARRSRTGEWKEIGATEYTICDWDDPSSDRNGGSVIVDARKREIKLTILAHSRSGLSGDGFVMGSGAIRKLKKLIEKALSNPDELTKDRDGDGMSHATTLMPAKISPLSQSYKVLETDEFMRGISDKEKRRAEKRFGGRIAAGKVEYRDLTFEVDSVFLISRYASGGIFIFIDENVNRSYQSSCGGDIEVFYDVDKIGGLLDILSQATQIAMGPTEDWQRIGFAEYTWCDHDNWNIKEHLRGSVIADARMGRIRLTFRCDPRSERGDYSIVIGVAPIQELVVAIEKVSPLSGV